jgi:hypothetical protein
MERKLEDLLVYAVPAVILIAVLAVGWLAA